MEDFARRGKVAWRDTLLDTKPPQGPYAARPLHGIWAAAPFLHNGSIPTLHDLLLPPDDRPKAFIRGLDILDPEKGGFQAPACVHGEKLVSGFCFDTAQRGNGNGGHLFGVDLSSQNRSALLAYLLTF